MGEAEDRNVDLQTPGRLQRPQARMDLVGEDVGDGLVIYDPRSHAAHSLPAAAASVFTRCDGRRQLVEIAEEAGIPIVLAEQVVAELHERGLLAELPAVGTMSRRDAIRRLALVSGAAVTAPLIYSVLIEPAAAAASNCLPNGSSCTDENQCCSLNCSGGTCEQGEFCLPDGTDCTNAGQCCSGLCIDDRCGPLGSCAGTGMTCTQGSQCCSGQCINSLCT